MSTGDTRPGNQHGEMQPATHSSAQPVLPSLRVLLGSVLALCAGLAIAWVDTRPRWDDAGITAGAVLIAAAISSMARVPPLLAAALVVGPMVVAELSHGAGVLIAIPFAMAGAYVGALVRRRIVGS